MSKNHLKMRGKSNISISSFEIIDKYISKSLCEDNKKQASQKKHQIISKAKIYR